MTGRRSLIPFAFVRCDMPIYYFDVHDGELCRWDDRGVDLRDIEAARQHAAAILPDLLRSRLPDGDRRTLRCLVRDASNRLIYRATLSLHGEWLS